MPCMPRDEQLPWDHVPAQLSSQEATELILQHIEKGQVFAKNVVSKADKKDLRKYEKKAVRQFDKMSNLPKRRSAPDLHAASAETRHHSGGVMSMSNSSSFFQRPNFQRGFGVSKRPPIYAGIDNDLSPGEYDTHLVGAMVWEKEIGLSHPAQKQLSSHKSPSLVTFTQQKGIGLSQAKITGAPGPGHYKAPDYWDATWQHHPPAGTSFARTPPEPGDSRFGGLAKGILKN